MHIDERGLILMIVYYSLVFNFITVLKLGSFCVYVKFINIYIYQIYL